MPELTCWTSPRALAEYLVYLEAAKVESAACTSRFPDPCLKSRFNSSETRRARTTILRPARAGCSEMLTLFISVRGASVGAGFVSLTTNGRHCRTSVASSSAGGRYLLWRCKFIQPIHKNLTRRLTTHRSGIAFGDLPATSRVLTSSI